MDLEEVFDTGTEEEDGVGEPEVNKNYVEDELQID